MHIYKKSWEEDVESHRPDSMPLVPGYGRDYLECNHMDIQDNHGIRLSQHGLWKGRCLTKLISFYNQVT